MAHASGNSHAFINNLHKVIDIVSNPVLGTMSTQMPSSTSLTKPSSIIHHPSSCIMRRPSYITLHPSYIIHQTSSSLPSLCSLSASSSPTPIINHHQSSSIISNKHQHRQPSSTIIHNHQSPSIIIDQHRSA